MRAATMRAIALGMLATASFAGGSEAQTLAQRVRAVGTGLVTLHYDVRPGICGDGRRFFSMGGHSYYGEWTGGDRMRSCQPGPARVRMRVDGGTVSDVKVAVGPSVSTEERATDLGAVSSREAAEFFLALADSGSGRVGHGGITAAVIADSVSVWRRLLAIASNTERVSGAIRRDAMFWASRFAAAKLSGHGEDLAAVEDDDDGDREDTRNAAVFALSQLRGKAGVEPLMQIARTHKDPHVRRQALFWLGQSGDPRAVALFGEILSG